MGAHEWVVARLPCRLYSGVRTARAAARTAGKYSGRQPAMTALAANTGKAGITRRGDMAGSGSLSPCVVARKRSTRSSVGMTRGKPSLQPCANAYSFHCAWSISPRSRTSVSAAASMALLFTSVNRHQISITACKPKAAVCMRSINSSAFNPPKGCFTTITCGSTLRALAWACTRGKKVSVVRIKLVTPRFLSSMLSWKLHDEHAPQSAMARIAARYLPANSSYMPSGAGWAGLSLWM